MSKNRGYTKEFLINEFWRFYNENGRYPYRKDLTYAEGYPSESGYMRIWGNWDNFLKDIGIVSKDTIDGWYKCDEQVIIDLYENGSQEEIIDKLMIKRTWGAIKVKASKLGIKRNKSEIRKVFSDNELLDYIRDFHSSYNVVPTIEDFTKLNYPSFKVYSNRFGSWNNALRLVGLTPNTIFDHSKESIIKEVKDFYSKNKRSPLYNELSVNHNTIKNYWDSWNKMLMHCGLPVNKNNHNLSTKEDGIIFLQELFNEIGRIPNREHIESKGLHQGWFAKIFGSYRHALYESGLIDESELITKEEWLNKSIDGLISLFNNLGKVPVVEDYDKFAKDNKLLNRRALESNLNMTYNEICLEYLGDANQISKSKDELISDLKILHDKLGRPPMAIELRRYGLSSLHQYMRTFDKTFNQIIIDLGWHPTGHSYVSKSKEEMLEDYMNLYNELNRLPLPNDIDTRENMVSYSTYKKHFGGLVEICNLLEINFSDHVSQVDVGLGFACLDKNGDLCRSFPEMLITNIFIDNGVRFKKEKMYKELIPYYEFNYRMDWYLEDYDVCVEYFGLFDEKHIGSSGRLGKYADRTLQKINDCRSNHIDLIEIYPEDIDEDFELFIEKFRDYGIKINL